MSTLPRRCVRRAARDARGFTLVELMVTVAIALFLLGGLVTIVGNVRKADVDQRALAQLQDQERFALTVITDVVQAAGYFPDPVAWTPASSLVAKTDATGPWEAGQALNGIHVAAPPGDTLAVRYRTGQNSGGQDTDHVILCDGSTINGALLPNYPFTNTFTVQAGNANPALNGLYCSVDNQGPSAVAPGVLIVPGVVNMKVYYGVKRNFGSSDYNVDTYLTADQMCSLLTGCGDDWSNVSSVRVILTFTNPLALQPGQPPTIQFERVIEVMARGGVHT